MKRVKIISGTYGHRPEKSKFITPVQAGEYVTVSDEEAARLICLSVATYADNDTAKTAIPPVATLQNGRNEGEERVNTPMDKNGSKEQETDNPDDGGETPDITNDHFTMESLEKMTSRQLAAMAKDMGIDVSKCKNKRDVAALIAAVEVGPADDDDTPPTVTPEDPA